MHVFLVKVISRLTLSYSVALLNANSITLFNIVMDNN
jgi:hypothetical protein